MTLNTKLVAAFPTQLNLANKLSLANFLLLSLTIWWA